MRMIKKIEFGLVGICLFTGLVATSVDAAPVSGKQEPAKEATARVVANYGKLPLSFEKNQGQTNSNVEYLSRGPGYTLFLSRAEAVLSLTPPEKSGEEPEAIKVQGLGHLPDTNQSLETTSGQSAAIAFRWLGAKPKNGLKGRVALPGRMNYFIGSDPAKWQTNIPTYSEVDLAGLYPGIDIRYYGSNEGRLEYDLIVAPGANPKQIRLEMNGADRIKIDKDGAIITTVGELEFLLVKPVIYQEGENGREIVSGGYRFISDNKKRAAKRTVIAFDLGAYDQKRSLVIDPFLVYSTYMGGGGGNIGYGIAVDSSGAAYVTGATGSSDFPTTAGAFDASHNGGSDVFVTKLSTDGSALIYGTYMGGARADTGRDIAVDGAGAAYVRGETFSINFPTTVGALDTSFNGGFSDAFVVKLSPDGGTLVYGTYLGGGNSDAGNGIAVDRVGAAYVTGMTESSDFPTTLGAFDRTFNGGDFRGGGDAFVAKISADGSALIYGTYIGGGSGDDSGYSIAVDGAGAAYVTGETFSTDFPTGPGAFDTTFNGSGFFGGGDAFVAKISADGSALIYGTYIGGGSADSGYSIAVDRIGAAYVAGYTRSTDFPASPGAFDTTFNGGGFLSGGDAFVAKLSPDGGTLVYGTYLGGSDREYISGIAVDGAGATYVTGETDSTNFPTTPVAFDATFNGGVRDAFVAKLSPDGGTLVYGTYMGGSGRGFEHGYSIAVDGAGAAYVTGYTVSSDFPTTPGVFDTTFSGGSYDAFVAKIDAITTPPTSTPPPRPASREGGCFIATAAYGSYLDPHVQILRMFRDDILLQSSWGRAFVAFYYEWSPPVADVIRSHEGMRTVVRWGLTPIVYGVVYPKMSLMVVILVGVSSIAILFLQRRRKANLLLAI